MFVVTRIHGQKAENNSNVHQLVTGKYQWNVYAMEYCLAIKNNEVLTHAIAWKKLGENMPSKRPSMKEHILNDSTYMKCPD